MKRRDILKWREAVMIKRLAAAVGAAVMLFNSIPVVYADTSVVTITSADDFIDFLKGCTSDEYSRGRTFVINNDIDMSGKEFTGGGIFCGTLMGNGHVIRNISMDFREANGGLFSNVGNDGQVRDLNISGSFHQYTNSSDGISTENIVGDIIKNAGISGVSPASSTGITGAVAAVNSGLILNCSFEGDISGQKTTGGIVGRNEDTGIIDTCANAAEVSGIENTGGIAGENSGVIKNSRNSGKVNPEAEETTKETGGIAGLSTGVIEYSNNEGEVGCEGYGINAGGIAGKQNGAIMECKNTGIVGAKKNAGGIVGIFVPFTDADIIADDLKNEWQRQKDDLKSEADRLRDNLKKNAEELTDSFGKFNLGIPGITSGTSVDKVLNSLANYLDSAAKRRDESSQSLSDNIDSLSGAIESAINDRTLENQVNESLSTLSSSISEVTSSMADAMDRTAELADDVETLSSNLTSLTNDTSALLSTLNDNASGAGNRLDRTVDSFEDISNSLSYALDRADIDTRALDNAAKALLNLSETLDDVVYDLSDLGDDVSAEVLAPFRTLRRELNKIISDINDRKQNAAELRKKLEELRDKLEKQIGALPTMRPLPTRSPRSTDKPFNIGKAIADKLFITAEAAEEDNSRLSLDEIIDTERIREEMKKAISVDVTLDRRVAGEYTDTALVKNCINAGEVRANENSGGISGNMGVETLRQRGETLQLPDGKTVISDLAVKATVHSCINDGEIYAKERNAGGIVGSSNVGIIKSCLGAGEVCAENDGYAGGIGGNMNASILYSIGAARLSGENDLGGIAGKGNVIRESYSLASFEGNAERIGMIAGSVDGDVKNNCFISEEIGGIGGASYENNAENISFEEMKCTDKLPERMDMFFNDDWVSEVDCFPQIKNLAQTDAAVIGLDIKALSAKYAETQFRVNFIVDGDVVKSLKKEYNEMLTEEEIPELKGSDGRYPHWNRDTSEPIRRHTDFKAEYNDATMTIASEETPPILLVEGNFSDATTVDVDDTEITADFSGYIKGSAYSFKINPKKDGEGGFKLHILARDDRACAIGVVNNGVPEVIECERDGSYLICQMDKTQSFVILSRPGGAVSVTILISIVAVAALAIVGVFAVRKKRMKEAAERE